MAADFALEYSAFPLIAMIAGAAVLLAVFAISTRKRAVPVGHRDDPLSGLFERDTFEAQVLAADNCETAADGQGTELREQSLERIAAVMRGSIRRGVIHEAVTHYLAGEGFIVEAPQVEGTTENDGADASVCVEAEEVLMLPSPGAKAA